MVATVRYEPETMSVLPVDAEVANEGAIDAESGLGDPDFDALGKGTWAGALPYAGEARLPVILLAEAEASRNEGKGTGTATEELEGTLTDW